jgi:hypothetical protein
MHPSIATGHFEVEDFASTILDFLSARVLEFSPPTGRFEVEDFAVHIPFFKGITKNPKPQSPPRVETISALVNRASGVSRVMFGTCLPVRVCFFVPKAASSLAQAFFFTESYDPVGSYL